MRGELPSISGNSKMIENRYKCCKKDVSMLYKNHLSQEKY